MNLIVILLIILGLFFFLGTAVGMLRLPDFYTRSHAAGKGDTLSTVLILFACGLYTFHEGHYSGASLLVFLKILSIVVFIFISSPTSCHAFIDAGYETGAKQWNKMKALRKKKASNKMPENKMPENKMTVGNES